jgi:hypothetical protein
MSKSTKKKSAKKPKEAAQEPVNQISEEERMKLKILVLERNNAQLALQNLQQQLQATNTTAQETQKDFEGAVVAINSKYGLDAAKDNIDINTGVITRG